MNREHIPGLRQFSLFTTEKVMLARLSLLFALVIGTMPLMVEGAIASPDIGGAPVKAITPETTYSTIYTQTNFVDAFGSPQTFILIKPNITYSRISINHPRTVIVTPNIQTPIVPFGSGYPRSISSCGNSLLTLSSGRTLSFNSGSACW